ncbi:MAG: TRAP transporter substrate-binding protein [Treponema sp.]|nr:TRAP transporter substrate-binding protein [Treponema sp.]
MVKRVLWGAVCAALVVSLCSCKKKQEEKVVEKVVEEVKPVTIKLGFSTNMEDPRGVASNLFKDEVEKNSRGKILVEIFPNGKLGSDADLISGVINDSVDMTVSSAGNFAVYATKLGISALPFLFSDFESAWRFMDSDIIAQVNKTLEEFNTVVLSHYDNGFRCVTTTNKPVNSVADMKGLNIRTPPSQIVMETMSTLGANPKPYDFPKLKQALKDGLFDSQENPIPVIYNNKLYDEQKYLAITNHSYDAMPLVIRKKLWDSFDAASQKILLDAAKKAQNLDRNLVKAQTESYVVKLKEAGMTITTPNLKEFAKATDGVMDAFATIYGADLIAKMRAATK